MYGGSTNGSCNTDTECRRWIKDTVVQRSKRSVVTTTSERPLEMYFTRSQVSFASSQEMPYTDMHTIMDDSANFDD